MDLLTIGYYFLVLVGLYLVGTAIYNIVMVGNRDGWILNGITAAIGGGIAYFAYSKVAAPPSVIQQAMSAGSRKRWW